MAHCAFTAAQPTQGYLRRLGMRGPRRQDQFVLRRQGETHPGQHRFGATAVQPRVLAARLHIGPELSDFQPVTIDEVRKLLASIPSKTSPLEVLPVSLLKDCAEVFAPAITMHTRQLVTADRKVPSTLQISAGAAATEEGGARQVVASQLQANI